MDEVLTEDEMFLVSLFVEKSQGDSSFSLKDIEFDFLKFRNLSPVLRINETTVILSRINPEG